MFASDENRAFKALNKDGFNKELFEQIKQGTLKRYPRINLLAGCGFSLQNLEGALPRKVVLAEIE